MNIYIMDVRIYGNSIKYISNIITGKPKITSEVPYGITIPVWLVTGALGTYEDTDGLNIIPIIRIINATRVSSFNKLRISRKINNLSVDFIPTMRYMF